MVVRFCVFLLTKKYFGKTENEILLDKENQKMINFSKICANQEYGFVQIATKTKPLHMKRFLFIFCKINLSYC